LKLEEIKEIINLTKIKCSPGSDLIIHYLLKLIPDFGLIKLLKVFEITLT